MLVNLQTAKLYLRVDSSDEDEIISSLISTSEKICRDVLRVSPEEDLSKIPEMDVAILYTLAYLYEHREEANHKALMSNLRSLLSGDRREVF